VFLGRIFSIEKMGVIDGVKNRFVGPIARDLFKC
jgi:hypothetical protein